MRLEAAIAALRGPDDPFIHPLAGRAHEIWFVAQSSGSKRPSPQPALDVEPAGVLETRRASAVGRAWPFWPCGQPSPGAESAILAAIGLVFRASVGGRRLAPAGADGRTTHRLADQAAGRLGGALRAVGAETQDGGGVVPGRLGVEEFEDAAEAEDWATTLRDEVAVDG